MDVKDTLKARSGAKQALCYQLPSLGHERKKAKCFVIELLRSAKQAAVFQQQQHLNAVTQGGVRKKRFSASPQEPKIESQCAWETGCLWVGFLPFSSASHAVLRMLYLFYN